jgi:hypothetical protein
MAPSALLLPRTTGGTSGGTLRDKDEEIRVRMGKFGFQPRLGRSAPSGLLSSTCIENKGFILAPQVGFEPTTLRLTAERPICLCSNSASTNSLDHLKNARVRVHIVNDSSELQVLGLRNRPNVCCQDQPTIRRQTLVPDSLDQQPILFSAESDGCAVSRFPFAPGFFMPMIREDTPAVVHVHSRPTRSKQFTLPRVCF